MRCGYCAAEVPAGDYIRHDIVTHDGLERVRTDHQLLCSRMTVCICRIEEYERVADQIVKEALQHDERTERRD